MNTKNMFQDIANCYIQKNLTLQERADVMSLFPKLDGIANSIEADKSGYVDPKFWLLERVDANELPEEICNEVRFMLNAVLRRVSAPNKERYC